MTPTRDELLKLAKKADLPISSENYDIPAGYERFAALLCAHQAQAEPVAPHIVEALSYHARERDDMTIDDAIEYLRNGWEKVRGRTERELILQILALLASAPPSSDQSTVDELKRRLADMCREYEALSVKADQTWNEAIEAAAKKADEQPHGNDIADRIRALMKGDCKSCPHAVGDAYQRDCAFPDCLQTASQAQEPTRKADGSFVHCGDSHKSPYEQPVSAGLTEDDLMKLWQQCGSTEGVPTWGHVFEFSCALLSAAHRPANSQDGSEDTSADARDAIRELIGMHAEMLESGPYAHYCYFELAFTRYTGWMAWICSNQREKDPDRKILAKGQGSTPDEACRQALAAIAASRESLDDRA